MSKAKQTQAAKNDAVLINAPVNAPINALVENNAAPVAAVSTNQFLNKLGFAPELPKSAMKVEDKLTLMRKGFVDNATKHIAALKGEKVEGKGAKEFVSTYKELPDGSFRVVLKNGHVVFREDNTAKNSPRLSITAKTKDAAFELLTAAVKGCNDGDLDEIFKKNCTGCKGRQGQSSRGQSSRGQSSKH
jgi:hypothetical protein